MGLFRTFRCARHVALRRLQSAAHPLLAHQPSPSTAQPEEHRRPCCSSSPLADPQNALPSDSCPSSWCRDMCQPCSKQEVVAFPSIVRHRARQPAASMASVMMARWYRRWHVAPDEQSMKNTIQYDRLWLQRVAELRAYKEEHGDCLVPKRYPDNPRLANWVCKQRDLHKKGKMEEWRLEMLEEEGFCWDLWEKAWAEKYTKLCRFREEHGHCLVPYRYKELGEWVNHQRRKKDKLSAERLQRLNSLRFVWDVLEAQWEERYLQMVEFKQDHGHCLVPQRGSELGRWVLEQRQNHKKGVLAEERVKRLESLGFVWDARD